MKTDRYTKFVLTIIALCMFVIICRDVQIIPGVQASTDEPLFSQFGLIPMNEDGSINVHIINSDELDVNIADISTTDKLNIDIKDISTYESLDVNLEEVGGTSFYLKGNRIPVNVDTY